MRSTLARVQARGFARRGGTIPQYTKPLVPNSYEITPPRFVPEHIVRPPYVGQDPQVFPNILTDPIYTIENPE